MVYTPSQLSTMILIIEPNEMLETPYKYLNDMGTIQRVPSIGAALKEVIWNVPSLVFLSASVDAKKSLIFLETLKDSSRFSLVPIVIVVDFGKEISSVLGTTWGGKIAVVDCFIPKKDLISTIARIS